MGFITCIRITVILHIATFKTPTIFVILMPVVISRAWSAFPNIRKSEVTIKIAFFWDVTPCSFLNRHKHFGGVCCHHRQGHKSDSTTLKLGATGSSETVLFYHTTRLHIQERRKFYIHTSGTSSLMMKSLIQNGERRLVAIFHVWEICFFYLISGL